jgi:acetyl esterase/lipase
MDYLPGSHPGRRPTPHQDRADVELAAAMPFLITVPFDNVREAREIVNQQTRATLTQQDSYLQLVEVDWHDTEVARTTGPDIPIRVYTPRGHASPLGVLMFIHGGGFTLGNLDSEHTRCVQICSEAQCVVVRVDYRLAPEHPYPAALNDCYETLEWISRSLPRLGVDAGSIAVGGASAGGNLAAAVALKARDDGGPRIALQLLIYPVIDVRMITASMEEFDTTPIWDSHNNKSMWSFYLVDDEIATEYASPILAASLEGLPPAAIIAAELDPLRDEAIEYASALMRANVPVDLICYRGAYHGFDVAFPFAEISQRSLRDQIHMLRRALSHS